MFNEEVAIKSLRLMAVVSRWKKRETIKRTCSNGLIGRLYLNKTDRYLIEDSTKGQKKKDFFS